MSLPELSLVMVEDALSSQRYFPFQLEISYPCSVSLTIYDHSELLAIVFDSNFLHFHRAVEGYRCSHRVLLPLQEVG